MYLHVKSVSSNYNISLEQQITVIIGNSSTGKSTLVETLNKKRVNYETDASKLFYDINELFIDIYPEKSLFILDEDLIDLNEKLSYISSIKRSDLYFLIMSRKSLRQIPLSVESVHKFINVQGITKNVNYFNRELIKINKFNKLIVEDSKSGYYFFKKCVDSCESSYGNSNLLKMMSKTNLIIFDSLGFGGYITELLDKVNNDPSLLYTHYKSFEAFILEEVYRESTDFKSINPEKEAYIRLKEILPGYSKACTDLRRILNKNEKSILEKSALSHILEFYVKFDSITEELNKLDIPLDLHSKVRDLLPSISLPEDLLKQAIEKAVELVTM